MTRLQEETSETETWEEVDGQYGGDDDEDNEEDESEEIARRLGDQLWADINKAQADRAASLATLPAVPPLHPGLHLPDNPAHSPPSSSKKEQAVIATMKAILSHAQKDALALSIFSSTIVPDSSGQSVLDVLNRTVESGTISGELAKPLSHLIVSLARSEPLFATLRHSNAASIQLDKGKRKRDESDEGHFFKKPFLTHSDIQSQVTEAVRLVTHALSANPSNHYSFDPSLVSSIQLPLHQIFIFAVTASAGGGPEMNALQEISGLIQVVGVLSGIQIGSTSDSDQQNAVSQQLPLPAVSANTPTPPWLPVTPGIPSSAQTVNISTAVYPCLVPACRKIFSRLYSLRAHQRGHVSDRPFRCGSCPASFARNHDLKRHAKLHEKKAWKCCGCDKMFSRRDAIKRHKNSHRSRGGQGDLCTAAEVKEVDVEQEGDEIIKEGRRARIWNGIAGHQAVGYSGIAGYSGEERFLEEGEVDRGVIAQIQMAVTSLHPLLQARVAGALGIPAAEPTPSDIDSAAGLATLASVIARAQSQNLHLKVPHVGQQPGLPTMPSAAVAWGIPDKVPSDHRIRDQRNETSEAATSATAPMLSRYGLSEEQTAMLERAIANAASAAHAQAEAEAALEEEEEKGYDDDEEKVYDEKEGNG